MENTGEVTQIIDREMRGFRSSVKYPYYRIRGKSVTEEQALEIIRRTNGVVADMLETGSGKKWDDFILNLNFYNHQTGKSIRMIRKDGSVMLGSNNSLGYGWVHVDGTVGVNGITDKWPDADEFVDEWMEYLEAFPYLELVVAVTKWYGFPNEERDQPDDRDCDFESAEFDDEFLEAIEAGIYVHGNTVELINPERTREKYKEYAALYENNNRDKYKADYYKKRRILQIDDDILMRYIESYGLDKEKVFQHVADAIWLG